MTLHDYLQSEQAREELTKLFHRQPSYFTQFLDGNRIWHGVRCNKFTDEEGPSPVIYYRPDGDRYIVTDLGEGVRALRLRTGHHMDGARNWADEHVDSTAGVIRRLAVIPADLPDALCRVMFASLQVASCAP